MDKKEKLLIEIVCIIVLSNFLCMFCFLFLNLAEYSCAMKSHFRKFGNQMSGSGNHLCNYASLLA